MSGPKRFGGSRIKDKPCPVDGCVDPVRPGQLMCLAHWKMVPRGEQRAVWAAYSDRDWRAYARAARKAIASASGKPEQPELELGTTS